MMRKQENKSKQKLGDASHWFAMSQALVSRVGDTRHWNYEKSQLERRPDKNP